MRAILRPYPCYMEISDGYEGAAGKMLGNVLALMFGARSAYQSACWQDHSDFGALAISELSHFQSHFQPVKFAFFTHQYLKILENHDPSISIQSFLIFPNLFQFFLNIQAVRSPMPGWKSSVAQLAPAPGHRMRGSRRFTRALPEVERVHQGISPGRYR